MLYVVVLASSLLAVLLALALAREVLEQERKQIAAQRHRDPVLAASIQTVGLVLAALLPLVVCIYVLKQMSRSEPDDGAVAELLVSTCR